MKIESTLKGIFQNRGDPLKGNIMEINDLRTGHVLEFKRGRKAVVMRDTIFGNMILHESGIGHDPLGVIGDSLGGDKQGDYTVMRVWVVPNMYNSSLLRPSRFRKLINESTKILWEREEKPIEMSIDEIERRLGIEGIKIVKN
ncbi:MAG: hypothetical protein U9R24_07735 [Thermodesulfobacteriota bacterium]|nr:hypothetical protein [Thermodesulfobacteriota bacterium]